MKDNSETSLPALLSPAVQNTTRLLSILLIAGIVLIGWWSNDGTDTLEPNRPIDPTQSFRINLNDATVRELTLMPGIGLLTANRIIADRNQHGPFTSLSDLARVPGIGPKTIEAISPYCRPILLIESGESQGRVADR